MKNVKLALTAALIITAGILTSEASAIDRKEARQEAQAFCQARLGASANKQEMKKCVQRQTKRILRRDKAAEVCYALYLPVCGISNVTGAVKSYSNECIMRRNNAEKIHDGVCDARDK